MFTSFPSDCSESESRGTEWGFGLLGVLVQEGVGEEVLILVLELQSSTPLSYSSVRTVDRVESMSLRRFLALLPSLLNRSIIRSTKSGDPRTP